MKRIFKCIVPLLCLSLLCGCGGGGIYSNYRELDELIIIQTMGFDATDGGYAVSVSSGSTESEKIIRMTAAGNSITEAERLMQDYSAEEEIFYSHVNYIVLGESAAESRLTHCLDFIRRSPQMRPDTPLFVVEDNTAAKLILGAGNEDYDATDVLKSLERNLERRGDCIVFSAKEVISDMDRNGSALVCAVKTAKAGNSLHDAGDALTALPAGYAVIKDGRMVGQISYADALAVNLLKNKSGPSRITLRTAGESITVQLENCKSKLEPVLQKGRLSGLRIDMDISASLPEFGGDLDIKKAEAALKSTVKSRVENVLTLEKLMTCDFMQLGGILETHHPVSMAGMGQDFQSYLPDVYYIINIRAEINRSYDTDKTEDKI